MPMATPLHISQRRWSRFHVRLERYERIHLARVDIRINFANMHISALDPIVQESWTVLTHLHVTAKESSLQDDDNGKSVVILSGSPFATKKAKTKS